MAKDKIAKAFLAITKDKFTIDTIAEMIATKHLAEGDIVRLNGYYSAGDGANHIRKISKTNDGSGVQLANGLYANIVHSGEVNVSWFGDLSLNTIIDIDTVKTVKIPANYTKIVSETLYLKRGKSIKGENKKTSIIEFTDIDCIYITNDIEISNLTIVVPRGISKKVIIADNHYIEDYMLNSVVKDITIKQKTTSQSNNNSYVFYNVAELKDGKYEGFYKYEIRNVNIEGWWTHGFYNVLKLHTIDDKPWINDVYVENVSCDCVYSYITYTYEDLSTNKNLDSTKVWWFENHNYKNVNAQYRTGKSEWFYDLKNVRRTVFDNCIAWDYYKKMNIQDGSNHPIYKIYANGRVKIALRGISEILGDNLDYAFEFEGFDTSIKLSENPLVWDYFTEFEMTEFNYNKGITSNRKKLERNFMESKQIRALGTKYWFLLGKCDVKNNSVEKVKGIGLVLPSSYGTTNRPLNLLNIIIKQGSDNSVTVNSTSIFELDEGVSKLVYKVVDEVLYLYLEAQWLTNFGYLSFIETHSPDNTLTIERGNIYETSYPSGGSNVISVGYLPYSKTLSQLDTPYHASNMQKLGILDSYHQYLTDLHEYEKQQNYQSDAGVMNLNVIQPPIIPTKVEEYAKEYNLV